MSSLAASLSKSLPKPKYSGQDEELTTHSKSSGVKVVGADALDDNQIVSKTGGPPPYGNRTGWRPRSAEDFGDGGAFPEIPYAQYPLDMGRKKASSSNALALQLDSEGKVKYDAIARRGHGDKRIIHSEFKDLIPLRQQADAGELSLARPSEEDVAATRERTQNALTTLINGAMAAQKPKNVIKGTSRPAPTYVNYTADNQMGDKTAGKNRIIKIVQRQQDPMEPPKHKAKKIPRGPPSPPPPIMHSPPRKATAEEQEMWKIPPAISNWKNPKGFTVPLDKRLAADGRGLQQVEVNDKFAQLSESLMNADRLAREEVKQRAQMQQKLAEREKEEKEQHLRQLAQQAREDRANQGDHSRGRRASSASRRSGRDSRSRSGSASSRSSSSADSAGEAVRAREKARRERREDNQRELRQSRMGTERRMQQMAREQNRDISEKVALGLAKPSQSGDTMYDSRLFNQTSAFAGAGFNEDQAYDKPLFATQEGLRNIYRPTVGAGDDEDDGGDTMDNLKKSSRFEVLGRAEKGFSGAKDAEDREGPVQFEKESNDDPFNINGLIQEARDATSSKRGGVAGGSGGGGSSGGKRYGIQEETEGRSSKRARVDEDDDD